jgi:transglutaminase-like putative cysteine protease
MRRGAGAVSSVLVLLLVILAADSPAETYVNLGSLQSDNEMYVSPGVLVNENGGQVQYIEIASHHAVAFTADPLSQQVVWEYPFTYSHAPSSTWDEPDGVGNLLYVVRWGQSNDAYPGTIQNGVVYWVGYEFDVEQNMVLDGMPSAALFPVLLGTLPPSLLQWLQAGPMSQSQDATIVALAQSLVVGCTSQHQAVNEIVKWVDLNLLWTLGQPTDAVSVISDPLHRTQCAGFANTTIALLRAVGIPARFLAGTTAHGQYQRWWSPTQSYLYGWTYSGSHAWIDVYFPDVGWVPFDPQGKYNYIDIQYCRSCMGLDGATCYWHSVGYSYWGPQPTFTDDSIWDSSVTNLSGELHFRTIYTVPYGLPAPTVGTSDLVLSYPVGVPSGRLIGDAEVEVLGGNPGELVVLRYEVAREQRVRVTIYDVRGRLVLRLDDKVAPAGESRLEWSGGDWRGRAVASGTYFVLCQGEGWSTSKKVCFLR